MIREVWKDVATCYCIQSNFSLNDTVQLKTAAYLRSGHTHFSERKQLAKLAKRPADTT